MPQTVLLTSFTTWQPHQRSNSSDDLLEAVIQQNPYPQQLHFLRQIPVDFQLAPTQVLAKVDELQPNIIICCVESYSAKAGDIKQASIARTKSSIYN